MIKAKLNNILNLLWILLLILVVFRGFINGYYYNLANDFTKKSQYLKAEQVCKNLFTFKFLLVPYKQQGLADNIERLADTQATMRGYNKSKELYNLAYKLRKDLLKQDPYDYTNIRKLANIANSYHNRGDDKEAKNILIFLTSTLNSTHSKLNFFDGFYFQSLAQLYAKNGYYNEAEKIYLKKFEYDAPQNNELNLL